MPALSFTGIAHPAPGRDRKHYADLNGAEIGTTQMGNRGGTDILVEHEPGTRVGTVHASWESSLTKGMHVVGTVDDPATAARVRQGTLRGLSLGTGVDHYDGHVVWRQQDELSLCEQPRRAGCFIDSIDGKSVRAKHNFSNGSRVTQETHSRVSGELEEARRQLAILKAKTDMYDGQKREALMGMKDGVNAFITEIAGDKEFEAYKHELAPMTRWGGEMDKGESLDTNLSIGRLISCASAKFKRSRDEASANSDKTTLLANAMKELEEIKGDRDSKMTRISELEGLVEQRTKAAQAYQDELAKHSLLTEKVDFSQKSARENTDAATAGGSSSAASSSSNGKAAAIDPNAALMAFMSSGNSNGGLKIMQSSTGHHHLGATSGENIYTQALAHA